MNVDNYRKMALESRSFESFTQGKICRTSLITAWELGIVRARQKKKKKKGMSYFWIHSVIISFNMYLASSLL